MPDFFYDGIGSSLVEVLSVAHGLCSRACVCGCCNHVQIDGFAHEFCFTVVVPIAALPGLPIAVFQENWFKFLGCNDLAQDSGVFVFVPYNQIWSAFHSGHGLQHQTWTCVATRGKVMMIVPLLAYMTLTVVCIFQYEPNCEVMRLMRYEGIPEIEAFDHLNDHFGAQDNMK